VQAAARRAWRTTAPLGVLAFWVGLLLAAWSYPSGYDWRYITISSLVYPERNPDGYVWARLGIALCGLTGMYWTALRFRSAELAASARQDLALWALGLGYLSMTCCVLLPARQLGIPRAHDLLALVAFIGICAGLMSCTFRAIARGSGEGDLRRCRRLSAAIVAGAALSPIVLAALGQAYVARALPSLPWVGLAWRERGVPVYLSFAFWEWIACAVFSVYTVALSAVAHTTHPRSEPARPLSV
jgi:hypothetical protein